MQPDERGECRLWDPAEDEAVLAYFPEHGRDWDGWARLLPGRSGPAISARASRLGVRRAVQPTWTREEELALVRGAIRLGREVGRPASACVAHLYHLRRAVIREQVIAGMPVRDVPGGRG